MPDAASWPAGPSEMAARIRAHDWAATPLGPIEGWSEPLRGAVLNLLASGFPGALVWGPGLVTIYNDGFRPILGNKPEALGRSFAEVWSEAWEEIGPIAERALAGEATYIQDFPLVINRSGEPEQAYFTFSYSPVLAADGTVLGMLDTVVETTARARAEISMRESEERQAFLLELSDALRPLADPAAIQGEATRQLLKRLDLSRCYYSEFDDGNFTVLEDAFRDGLPSLAGTHDFSDCPEYIAACLAGRVLAVSDIVTSPLFSERVKARYAPLGARAALLCPLVKDGELISVFSAVRDEARPWPEWEVDLVGEVAERTWAAVERARAEAALRESATRFRQFGEASSDVLWIVNADTRQLEYLSPAYERVWGTSRDAVMADIGHWASTIHPDDLPAPGQGIEALFRNQRYIAEYRIIRADGTMRYIHDTGFPIHDEGGRLVRVAGVAQDLTDRREAELALMRSEERFRLVVENARDFAIFTTDAADRITDWFPGAEAVFGWTAEEAIGQPASMTFTPEDRAAHVPQRETQAARHQASAPDVRWHKRKDGGRVFLDGTVTALRDATGEVTGYVKIGRDITERHRAEQALAESESRARTLVEGVPQLVWRSQIGGDWTWASPQWTQFTGQPEPESHGQGWLQVLHPDDRRKAVEAWSHAEAEGGFEVDYRLKHHADGYRWFHTRARGVRDEVGRIVEWLGTSTDVDELYRLQRHQRVLMAELQHRVRNTLGVVRSIVRRTAGTTDTAEEMAGMLQGRLAAFSRVQAALTRAPDAEIDLATLVNDELLAHAARESETVSVRGPSVLLKPRVAESLSLAIHELTSNAVKYGALSQNGRLQVRWSVQDAGGRSLLELVWQELGVELPEREPKRQGFGLELLERTLPYELDAITSADFLPTGFRFSLSMPLEQQVGAGL